MREWGARGALRGERAFAGGGVHLVTVPVDYSENERVLVQELRQRLPVTPEVP